MMSHSQDIDILSASLHLTLPSLLYAIDASKTFSDTILSAR